MAVEACAAPRSGCHASAPDSSGGRLCLLLVSPSIPYPPRWGFGIRVYQFLRHLAEEHEVSLATFAWPDDGFKIAAVQALGVDVHVAPMPLSAGPTRRRDQALTLLSLRPFAGASLYTREMQRLLDSLLIRRAFDLVQIESSPLAAYRFATAAPLLLDEHNIEFELLQRVYRAERKPLRRAFGALEYVKFRREEIRSWGKVSGALFTSEREQKLVARYQTGLHTWLAPNGVDTDYFAPAPHAAQSGRIVFTGLMNYRPNLDAALYFIHDILPLILQHKPQAVFTVVGMGPPQELLKLAGPNVTITGEVEDVRPFVRGAAVEVVPLRMGGGTRLKVLEGLAMRAAMVSTRLGCEGIDVRHGEHLLVADDPDEFARSVIRLMDEPALARRLGEAGRTLAQQRYSWAAIVDDLKLVYRQILRDRHV